MKQKVVMIVLFTLTLIAANNAYGFEPAGSEFQVNQYVDKEQNSPTVAIRGDGHFVITWQSNGQDGSETGVFARMYDSDGNPLDDEFQVNSYTTGEQQSPGVAMNTSGDFVIAWNSYYQNGSYRDVYAQMYSSSGNKVGNEFRVNTYTDGRQGGGRVAMNADGHFVILWNSLNQVNDNSGWDVFVQLYDNEGNPLGNEFQVNECALCQGDQLGGGIGMDAYGHFVVAWASANQDGWDVFARVYKYESSNNTVEPASDEFQVNPTVTGTLEYTTLAMNADGHFVITWTSDDQNGDDGVFARMYEYDSVNNSVIPVGGEFQVNTYATGNQQAPRVAMDANGDFVITWASYGQDGDGWGAFAQLYDNEGNPIGDEFQVNECTSGIQNSTEVAMNADGNFVITWQSWGQGGPDCDPTYHYDVFARRYVPNAQPIADPGGPYLGAAGSTIDFDGTGSSDPDGDLLTYFWDFGDSNTGTGATPSHTYADAGIYDLCLTVDDELVDSEEVCTIAVVYDPSAGFVTGGGWIDSPEGAYAPDPTLIGKANFGFVSKYKKGSTEPTGQTEFQFQATDLNFHSDSYEWLVVTGSNYANFKGTGTINGEGYYKFRLWAGDNEPDTFRIKIWTEDDAGVETVFYDNGFDLAIGGGSIVIHEKN
jgi:hypothetical protein